ncbi:MAG: signal peptidase I [Candidatus Saganbacteria bacterium]|nr:signal peptidase I [Candidatus Saganbacteria bacterium]
MEKIRAFIKETIETVVVALLIALFIRAFFIQIFWIPSESMLPTFEVNDRIIVDRLSLGLPNPLYDMNDSPIFLFNIPNPLYNTNFIFSNARNIYTFSRPKRMEVIVFKYPKDPVGTRRDFIKRIIGLPGETVSIKNGYVYINGRQLEEKHPVNRDNFNMPEVKVPEKSYFMMGDNRPNSMDSRFWGFAPEDNIIGRAVVRIWPLNKLSIFPGM